MLTLHIGFDSLDMLNAFSFSLFFLLTWFAILYEHRKFIYIYSFSMCWFRWYWARETPMNITIWRSMTSFRRRVCSLNSTENWNVEFYVVTKNLFRISFPHAFMPVSVCACVYWCNCTEKKKYFFFIFAVFMIFFSLPLHRCECMWGKR